MVAPGTSPGRDRRHGRIGLEDRHHLRVAKKRDVANMLLAHHAAADHAVGNGLVHRFS
jgi:hypothetical protein